MLESLLRFHQQLIRFQQIKRSILAVGEKREENDAEHSYQLAMVGWFLIEKEKLELSLEKVLLYALVHDLTELRTGDRFAYSEKPKQKLTDIEKEMEELFPDFLSVRGTIAAYEAQKDEESQFVYALDKLVPILNNVLDMGRSWKDHGVRLEDVKRVKTGKIKVSKVVEKYYHEVLALLEANQSEYF